MGTIEVVRAEADEQAARYLRAAGNVGLAIGLLAGGEEVALGYGETDKGSGRVPDGRTVFEIGSITKVFTALLLADAAGSGEVRLDRPVGELLPAGVRMPAYRGEPITLAHLAEHTSALPRLPGNLGATIKDAKNPYRDYGVEDLHAYLNAARVGFPPGSGASYSNLGAGLLGHVLALRAGEPYEDLLAARVLRPLGLADTAIALSADQEARMAPGHDAKGEPTSRWDLPTFAGAGALRSTVAEMLTFLRANLDPAATPLEPALRECQAPRPVAWRRRIGVGWPHALGLAAASLLVQWSVPVPPGSATFLAAALLPALAALAWKGFWSGAWAAAATWAGCMALWGSQFGWLPAGTTLFVVVGLAGLLSGYIPPTGRVRLGWQEATVGAGATALWHNGGTGGYRSFIGFIPGSRVGVAVLSNSANDVDAIGLALLGRLAAAAGDGPKP
ncbi:serine hydrolase domain-containing protein [Paludisphaera mucosa]|uniref:Serine hydrolase n=1 Tax=Paludisphaera mucosa TaxID=3030827 RepID=A0ABT6FBE8_9BACT|nr:serine hydrolase [Paludisphaera mucosa]